MPATQTAQSTDADRLWHDLSCQLREACVLRRQGRLRAANTILEDELPAVIRAWAAASGLPGPEAKARLNQLFDDEQARVESHWLIARFLAGGNGSVTPPTVPGVHVELHQNPAIQLPAVPLRRIPIADVVEMIDAARDMERTTAMSLFR
jgi:hypothetical protein